MKKISKLYLRLGVILSVGLFLNSCETDNLEPTTLNEGATTNQNLNEQFTDPVNVFYNGKIVTAERVDENNAIIGDIVVKIPKTSDGEVLELVPGEIALSSGLKTDLWSNGKVYYELQSNLDNTEKSRISDAISHWHARTTLEFIPRTSQSNYISFSTTNLCGSFVGVQGGMQEVFIGSCGSTGSVIHEIGHAVGLQHEQNRADRNKYINIHLDNIFDNREDQFDIGGNDFEDNTDFDFDSIMMYSSDAFSITGTNGMTTKNGGTWVGQRTGLSVLDALGIERMYSGSKKSSIAIRGSNLDFISSENGQKSMVCDRGNINAWEKFDIIHLDNGKVALRGSNGKYVTSLNGSDSGMICNRGSIGAWEQFDLILYSTNRFALRGSNGRYVTSNHGNGPITCDRTKINDWEIFRMYAQ